MQGDGNTRSVDVSIYENGRPWYPPVDADVEVAYYNPGHPFGSYNKLLDGTPAVSVNGNVVTVILTQQLLQFPGNVNVYIVFTDSENKKLTTFPFYVFVDCL